MAFSCSSKLRPWITGLPWIHTALYLTPRGTSLSSPSEIGADTTPPVLALPSTSTPMVNDTTQTETKSGAICHVSAMSDSISRTTTVYAHTLLVHLQETTQSVMPTKTRHNHHPNPRETPASNLGLHIPKTTCGVIRTHTTGTSPRDKFRA